MRYSQLFGKTIKAVPSEIKVTSHKYLHQGGFIRQISTGRYALLPLGLRVWQKVYRIIQQDIDRLGCQQLLTPTLHPIEFWQTTNRDAAFEDLMLVVEDHHGASFAIGATAEGMMVELVKKFSPSYKDLPIVIYQFSNKFRDEKRPRGGLLRVREFMMKDAYSFHRTEEDLMEWYQKFYQVYLRIAERLEIKVLPVEAYSGAIGGDYGHEFMVVSEVGEDTIFVCSKCDYAANIERADSRFESYPQDRKMKPREDVLTEEIIGVEALAEFLDLPVTQTTKTLLYKADDRVVAVCVRGDYNVNEAKLERHLGVSRLELASGELVKKTTGAEVGYAGPVNLPEQIQVVWDLTTQGRTNFEAGANRTNYHAINLNFVRDVKEPEEFVDIREVKAGEGCPNCEIGKLESKKAIEFGHCFKQDHFYTKPHQAYFVDEDGQEKPMWMGAYGIGVERAIATIIEIHHDERGILWPVSVAPYQVELVNLSQYQEDHGFYPWMNWSSGTGCSPQRGVGLGTTGSARGAPLDPTSKALNRLRAKKSSMQKSEVTADLVYRILQDLGLEVLYDDRWDVSAGEKFADADLIGIPLRLVLSEKTLEKDSIEIKKRAEDEPRLLPLSKINEILRYFK